MDIDLETSCYIAGIDLDKTVFKKRCVCSANYFGEDCGIPSYVWKTANNAKILPKTIRRRQVPRRVIYGLPLNHEFDLFETRMAMQYDVVDVFILHESNYTNSGGLKEPLFLHKFQNGWMKQYHDKFVYIFQDHFPSEGYNDGVVADSYMRRNLGQTAFHKRLKHFKDDDIFIYNDVDELVRPEVLLFLKLYEGFSEPIAFRYRWAIFGFFWTVLQDKFSKKKPFEAAASTVKFFRDFYNYDASLIRSSHFAKETKKNVELQKQYKQNGTKVQLFKCSNDAGWHCSYCFKPEGIRKKLLDAPRSDYPRHGDDPEKTRLNYIKGLIREGKDFDGELFRGSTKNQLTVAKDVEIAPSYMLKNQTQFGYLLINPYAK